MTRAITFELGETHCGLKILKMPDPLTKLVDSYYECVCVHCGNIFTVKHGSILQRYRHGIDNCKKCPDVKMPIKNKLKETRKMRGEYRAYLSYIPADIKDPVPWAPTDPHGMWPIYS